MTTHGQAAEAERNKIVVTLNGVKFYVYPAKHARVLQSYARTTAPKGGHMTSVFVANTWLRLNDNYQLHLGYSYSKDDVCKGAGMSVWDVAVPWDWQKKPEITKKFKEGEWAVWSYDGKCRTFGCPVWKTEIFRNLKRNILAALR